MTAPGRTRGSGAQAPAGRIGLGHVPMILMYHGVADVAEDPNQLCVTPGRFAEQMATLHRLGLRGVGIGTLLDAMRVGRQRGLVGITFDDGYVSVLETASPNCSAAASRPPSSSSPVGSAGPTTGTKAPPWPLLSVGQVSELAAAGHGDRIARRHACTAGRPGRRAA